MRINPVPSGFNVNGAIVNPDGQATHSAVQSIRSLKMNTNVTPEQENREASQNIATVPLNGIQSDEQSVEATQPMSPQFAALAKQRRALQVKERELMTREKALSSQTGQSDSVALARLKSEPLNVLLEAGVTYDQLTKAILEDQSNSEIRALKAEIDSLRDGVDQKLNQRDVQAEQQVLAEMRREAQQLASTDENFEMIKGTESIPDVMQLIERTYRKTGEVLDVREAMQLVEDELFKEAQKIVSLKKVQSQFIPQNTLQVQRHQGMRTLKNTDTASPPMSRKQRAIAAMLGRNF